jgi:hypothetical protein
MAINKNHEFEDLDGVKCAIVEKNVLPERVEFIKKILAINHYTVIVQPSPPPKVATFVVDGEVPALIPETFTVGVTDVMFNAINAVFGRLLKTEDGHIVTLAYWQQKEAVANDDIPYYEV